MGIYTIVVIAFGLAMDAFAVSVANGMCCRMKTWKNALSTGVAFGTAQAVMPLAGYFAGHSFSGAMGEIDHWLALVLLTFIGGRMLRGARRESRSPSAYGIGKRFSLKTLWLQAIATSIDALAVGVSLGVMQADLWVSAAIIGLVTFFCCFTGVYIGSRFGTLLQNKAEALGGIILILIGLHIFWEHMELHFRFYFR